MVVDEYAYALFEIGKEKNKLDTFSECFLVLKSTIEKENFLDILQNSSVDRELKKKMVKNVYKDLDLDFIYFLYVIIDHNRMNLLYEIIDSYNLYVLEESNTLKASVISTIKLSDKKLEDIKERLAIRHEGKNIIISNVIDETLLGGIKIVINNETIDYSLKNSLNRLKNSI